MASTSFDTLSINKILDELSEIDDQRDSIKPSSAKNTPKPSESRRSSWSSVISSSSSVPSSSIACSTSSTSDEEDDGITQTGDHTIAEGKDQDLVDGSAAETPSDRQDSADLSESLGSLASILAQPKYSSEDRPREATSECDPDIVQPASSMPHRHEPASPDQNSDGSSGEPSAKCDSPSSGNATDTVGRRSSSSADGTPDCPSPPSNSTPGQKSKNNGKGQKGTLKVDLLTLSPRADDHRTPSPLFGRRSPVGALGWRPVMPGYQPPKTDNQKVAFGDGEGTPRDGRLARSPDMSLKDYIPVMSKPLAVVCLVLNVLSPGLGTLIAGVSVLCCSSPRPLGTDRVQCLWVNTWVSVLQLLTTFLVLLGWIWSVMWGVAFLSISSKVEDEKEVGNETVEATSPRTARTNGSGSPRDESVREVRDTDSSTPARSTPQTLSVTGYYQSEPIPAPLIVLHENPLALTANAVSLETALARRTNQRVLNPYNPRHQRVIRRQEDDILPSYLLDGQALENIVIRNAPVPDQIVFGRQEAPLPPMDDDQRDHAEPGDKAFATADLETFGQELGTGDGPSSSGSIDPDRDISTRRDSRQRLL